MKFIALFFLIACVVDARHRRREVQNEADLPNFKVNELSENFRNFQLGSCADDVNQCLKSFHEKAKECVRTFKNDPKFSVCAARDDVKMAHAKFSEASFKWHKSMDMCLAGNICNDCAPIAQSDGPDADATDLFRKKRSHGSSESNSNEETNEDDATKKAIHKCWKDVEKAKKQCTKKARQCVPFASCYGEGTAPADERLANWHQKIKTEREATEKAAKTSLRTTVECLKTAAPPVRAGRGAGIAEPAGVVVDFE